MNKQKRIVTMQTQIIRRKNESGDEDVYIQGRASNDMLDVYETKMSAEMLNKWVRRINSGEITVIIEKSHDPEWYADMGEVIRSWTDVNEKGITSFYVEAKLYKSHPDLPTLLRKLDSGEEIGMSIYGWPVEYHIETETFTDDQGNEAKIDILVFDDIELERIALTRFPATPETYVKTLVRSLTDNDVETEDNDTELKELISNLKRKQDKGDNEVMDNKNKKNSETKDKTKVTPEKAEERTETPDKTEETRQETDKNVERIEALEDKMQKILDAVQRSEEETEEDNDDQDQPESNEAIDTLTARMDKLDESLVKIFDLMEKQSNVLEALGSKPEKRGHVQAPETKPEKNEDKPKVAKRKYEDTSEEDLIQKMENGDREANVEFLRRKNVL